MSSGKRAVSRGQTDIDRHRQTDIDRQTHRQTGRQAGDVREVAQA
jgi:hypothetical protein